MRCTVLGAGSWGTALAAHLVRCNHDVVLWDRNADRCAAINAQHSNPHYLSGIALPPSLTATSDLTSAVQHGELLVPAVPSHALRTVLQAAAPALSPRSLVACAVKGIEADTLCTMHDVCVQTLGESNRVAMIYGPTFAAEVAAQRPAAVVAAGPADAAQAIAGAFHSERFRAYHTEDVVGVCIGGSIKNVMAIACGVVDALALGANARSVLITRGLAEISRLATALGAHPLTMMGLAGVGDLVLTCTGDLSRNRRVGLGIGAGRPLQAILDELGEVAEGVHTAASAHELARKNCVEMPITEQVCAMLNGTTTAERAMTHLMQRERRAERD